MIEFLFEYVDLSFGLEMILGRFVVGVLCGVLGDLVGVGLVMVDVIVQIIGLEKMFVERRMFLFIVVWIYGGLVDGMIHGFDILFPSN
jgi:hypothetical protein